MEKLWPFFGDLHYYRSWQWLPADGESWGWGHKAVWSQIFLIGGSEEFVFFIGPKSDHWLARSEAHSLTQWCCWNLNDVTLADDSSVMKIPNQYLLLILIEALLFMLMKLQMLLTTDDALKRPLTYDNHPISSIPHKASEWTKQGPPLFNERRCTRWT